MSKEDLKGQVIDLVPEIERKDKAKRALLLRAWIRRWDDSEKRDSFLSFYNLADDATLEELLNAVNQHELEKPRKKRMPGSFRVLKFKRLKEY